MFRVSRIDFSEGDTLAIIRVFALPPREFFNNKVSFESQYQMKPLGFSANWLITNPNVVRL